MKLNPKLSFEFIGNACGIFIGNNGTKIICDPWIVDGVFDGSWFHYPPLKTIFDDIKNVDAIYISHLHPDHFDERHFKFELNIPILVLDDGPNFLIKKLENLGYKNLIKIKDRETIVYKEFSITMFAPFATHTFHAAEVGNLLDSAMLIECDGVAALNANDNTLTIEAAKNINEKYGSINLAMLNYNAAGPYPSCFDNLTESDKFSEHARLLLRNYDHMDSLLKELKPKAVLPFAGSYVLGGHMYKKNQYLGTATWDECAKWIIENGVTNTKIVLLRENDVLNIDTGIANKEYIPLDKKYMDKYISDVISKRKYPYELDEPPAINELIADLKIASENLKFRMGKFKIESSYSIFLQVQDTYYEIYPNFQEKTNLAGYKKYLLCNLDLRLLNNILHKKSHWNNAEIGAHITFFRQPNIYEPDLHTALQFLHL